MLEYLYLWLYRFFVFLLKILPERMVYFLMKGLAWLAYSFSKKHQKIIDTNLEIAFPSSLEKREKKAIGIVAFMNLIDMIFEGSDIVEQYTKEGKNFILVAGHHGNWELLSQSIAIKFTRPKQKIKKRIY